MKVFLVLLFAAALLVVGESRSIAQMSHWSKVVLPRDWTERNTGNITPYFITKDLGFIFRSQQGVIGAASRPALHRTTDGGKSWVVLPYFDSLQFPVYPYAQPINQLCFVSPSHGYAAVSIDIQRFSPDTLGGIYETRDTGRTWKRITSGHQPFFSVYATENFVGGTAGDFPVNFSTVCYPGKFYFSRDGGTSWDSIVRIPTSTGSLTRFVNVVGDRDSLIALIALDTTFSIDRISDSNIAGRAVYSTDAGATWNSRALPNSFPYGYWGNAGLFAPAFSCSAFANTLLQGDSNAWQDAHSQPDTWSFLRISPHLNSWDTTLTNRETSQYAAGTRCALYVPNANYYDPTNGVYRSTDMGGTWSHLPGPSFAEMDDYFFRNLSVVGYGAVVYACSDSGFGQGLYVLWKTTDGGDGALSEAGLAPRLLFEHQLSAMRGDTLMTQCDGGLITLVDQNTGCEPTIFQRITVDSLAPLEYTVTRTHHVACDELADTTLIAIRPLQSGIRTIRVHAHYRDDEFAEIDTSFPVTLVAREPAGSSGPSINVFVAQVSLRGMAGDTVEIPIYVQGIPETTSVTLPSPAIEYLSLSLATNLLTPIQFRPAFAGLTGSVGGETSRSADLTLTLSQPITFTGKTLLGTVRCKVYLTDTNATTVKLAQGWLTSQDSTCVTESVPEDQGAVFTLATACASETLTQFLKSATMPEDMLSIVPNPASTEVSLLLRDEVHHPITYAVTDAVGATRIRGTMEGSQVSLDVGALPTGMYYVRAGSPVSISEVHKLAIRR